MENSPTAKSLSFVYLLHEHSIQRSTLVVGCARDSVSKLKEKGYLRNTQPRRSSSVGRRTLSTNGRSQAPNARKLRRACVRLRPRFGPPRTSSASWSSCPSSSQKQISQISNPARSPSVRYPQHGQR